MKAFVDCFGCEQRQLDTQRVINYLTVNGVEITQDPKESDYAILVTCAVDQRSEEASADKLRDLETRVPKNSKIFVGGCMPSINPNRLSDRVAGTFSPRTMESLDQLLADTISVPMTDIADPNVSSFDDPKKVAFGSARGEYEQAKNGYKIRIDQGCLMKCSYCPIRLATGVLKSEDPARILQQFEAGVRKGEKSIMLVGGDTGAYGHDLGIRFHNLLEMLLRVKGDHQIFIHDFNLNWLAKDLDDYVKVFSVSEDEKRIRASTFPIQSGSDRILKLMKRPYTKETCITSLAAVRKASPSMLQGTHIIVGFPDETEQDFADTLDLLDRSYLDFVSCFPYSENERTASAGIKNKIASDIVNKRLDLLNERFDQRIKVYR